MKVKKILSNLNTWSLLNNRFKQEIEDVFFSIEKIDIYVHQNLSEINRSFINELINLNWDNEVILNKRVRLFDCIKNKVGIKLCLGTQAFLESRVFFKGPTTYKYDLFDVAIFVVPQKRRMLNIPGVNNFNDVLSTFNDLSPILLQYPFVIIAIGSDEDSENEFEVIELTTDLDEYLIRYTESSLETLISVGEKSNYDFKEKLPENKKISQEVCAFANMGGGILILGVTDSGEVIGINNNEIDEMQQKIVNCIRDSCNPSPEIDFYVFNHNLKDKFIMIVEVKGMEVKPCMTQERIYIRVGTTVRVAKPDEVRRLVLM
ncbi:helix-turn-helix domain-containing protein [Paenibacillus polymyxa]